GQGDDEHKPAWAGKGKGKIAHAEGHKDGCTCEKCEKGSKKPGSYEGPPKKKHKDNSDEAPVKKPNPPPASPKVKDKGQDSGDCDGDGKCKKCGKGSDECTDEDHHPKKKFKGADQDNPDQGSPKKHGPPPWAGKGKGKGNGDNQDDL